MTKDIILPDLGEGIDEVDISEVVVAEGDSIKAEDTLIVLESEKASMEIPSEQNGKVKTVYVKVGDQIKPGDKIVSLEISDQDAAAAAAPEKESSAKKSQPKPDPEPPTLKPTSAPLPPSKSAHASPGVRRLARELEIDLSQVPRTGRKGRLTKEDLHNYIKQRMAGGGPAPMPEIDFSPWGEIEEQPLNKIKRITGERMQQAWNTIPHVTQYDKADITDLDITRKALKKDWAKKEVKITFLPFLMKAVAQVLEEMPEFNSSLNPAGDVLILKKYIHLGIAVDTPQGLMVPVVRDVNKKDVIALSKELMDVSERARSKKIKLDEVKGAGFSISSLGGIGGTYFSPIVNPPEVAILGVSRTAMEPVYNEKEKTFKPRSILPYSLSYDHRVIDGASAARFTARLAELLSDPDSIPGIPSAGKEDK